jgi:hypothetical protein
MSLPLLAPLNAWSNIPPVELTAFDTSAITELTVVQCSKLLDFKFHGDKVSGPSSHCILSAQHPMVSCSVNMYLISKQWMIFFLYLSKWLSELDFLLLLLESMMCSDTWSTPISTLLSPFQQWHLLLYFPDTAFDQWDFPKEPQRVFLPQCVSSFSG